MLCAGGLRAQQHEMHMAESTRWRGSFGGTAFMQDVRTFGTRATHQLGSVNRAMIEASGPWLGGNVGLHLMGSAETLTLPHRGTPQHLQVAFTNDGETITDHAHPAPWIMELAASYERPLFEGITVSFYGAAIGAPALGPPAYLHRASAAANPAEPLGHHAQDITHSSFGVLTFGLGAGRLHLEGSAFNDRQPDEASTVFFYRGARLDAYSARASFTVAKGLSLSSSYGYLPAASGGHSHGALHRFGVTGVYGVAPWFVTIVYSANDPVGTAVPRATFLVEAEHRWTAGHVLFARAEYVKRTAEELSLVGSIGALQNIETVQLGYGRAVARLLGNPARLGASATTSFVAPELEPFYGSRTPLTLAVFGQFSWAAAVP